MLRIFYFGFAVLLLSTGCRPCKPQIPDAGSSDFFRFGRFYGECVGEPCIDIFSLQEGKLYEDTRDRYPAQDRYYEGSFVELPTTQYDKVKTITDDFPIELWNETNHVIGQPDAGDWGGLYVEYNHGGVHGFWLLDEMKDHVPAKYHHFIEVLNAKVDTLQ